WYGVRVCSTELHIPEAQKHHQPLDPGTSLCTPRDIGSLACHHRPGGRFHPIALKPPCLCVIHVLDDDCVRIGPRHCPVARLRGPSHGLAIRRPCHYGVYRWLSLLWLL